MNMKRTFKIQKRRQRWEYQKRIKDSTKEKKREKTDERRKKKRDGDNITLEIDK